MKALLILLALFPLYANAQYKCLAPDGVTEYRPTPCPGSPERQRYDDAQRAAQREIEAQRAATPSYWEREAARLRQKEEQERAAEEARQRFFNSFPAYTTGERPPDPLTVTRSGCQLPGGAEVSFNSSCAKSYGPRGEVRSVTVDGQTVYRKPR
jgi:hypothetical protein